METGTLSGESVRLRPATRDDVPVLAGVRTVARHLFEDHGHHRLVVDPAADNRAAIRCYSTVGFRPVGIMRGYGRGPDGPWHDGMLMDMLAHELA